MPSMSLSDITSKGRGLPPRIVFHGLEKVGKTSWASGAPNPIFLMTAQETGLLTLIDEGRVPETAHFPETKTYQEALEAIQLCFHAHYGTLVIDTINGLAKMCVTHVINQKFEGSFEKYQAYGKGAETAALEWASLLAVLDTLREQKRIGIIALCHTKVKTYKNPTGPDYDRYMPNVDDKIWDLTARWADAILFCNFETYVSKDGSRAKGVTGRDRIIYTERDAAYDAGNRYGLPPQILCGNDGAEAWKNFAKALREARPAKVQPVETSPVVVADPVAEPSVVPATGNGQLATEPEKVDMDQSARINILIGELGISQEKRIKWYQKEFGEGISETYQLTVEQATKIEEVLEKQKAKKFQTVSQ